MSSWSVFISLSGFIYDGTEAAVVAVPRIPHARFNCFWAAGTAWGTFSYETRANGTQFSIKVLAGNLSCRSVEIAARGATALVRYSGKSVPNQVEKSGDHVVVSLQDTVNLPVKSELQIEVRA